MTRHPTLTEIRHVHLDELDDQWRTSSEFVESLGLGHGLEWLKVALVLERLVNDGAAELQRPGSTVRRFRKTGDT
jgi:hypothetical protein